ncbi:MAG: HAMP domain-containing protein [Clostridia bacterium]|nr:HAMP domain-containing protein [Clostridia bacterium]
MHKKIFFRYFNACALVILITVFALGTVTTGVLTIRDVQEQDRQMENAAQQVASMLQGMPANYNVFVGSIVSGSIETVKKTINCEVVIINQRRRVVQTTLPDGVVPLLAEEAVERIFEGQTYRKQGTFIQSLGESYTIGVPILGDDGSPIGGVFATARQLRVNSRMREVMATFLICGLGIMVIAFICVYFITKQIVRPLNEIVVATRAYTKGDFSKRITVAPEGELSDLAATFNQMADGLERLETMRRGFIADVSHELRTPMTTIGGFIDGILDGTIPPELQHKYLALVSEEVGRLSRMVNNLLDVARIQSGEITYKMEAFNLTETIHRVLLTMEDRLEGKKIHLSLSLPEEAVYGLGDQDAIYRVVYNLVDNALKFTPEGGEIAIGLLKREKKINLFVRNSGQGIPEAEAGRIFERFYKTDKSRGENKRGVGLGLYMVKSIIDAHGEDITLTSKEGSFAEFSFSLREAEGDI